MKKVFVSIIILAIAMCAVGQVPANVKFKSYTIHSFRSDSIKWTPWVNVADYQSKCIAATFNDTSNAGYKGDSAHFKVLYQMGNPTYNSSGLWDTGYVGQPIVVDEINATTDANWKKNVYTTLQTDGTYADSSGCIDSTSVTGYGYWSRQFAPARSCYARVGVAGQAGNKKLSYVKINLSIFQFLGEKVNSKEVVE